MNVHESILRLSLKRGFGECGHELGECNGFVTMMDVCNEKLSSTCTEKLSKIKIDNKLTFEEHVE